MRTIAMVLLLSALVMAQASPAVRPTSATPSSTAAPNELIVPAGTKVPLALKHAVSTKSTREGDSVYAETTFPVVQDNRVLIPAGTYVQGRITHVQRAGRIKGRAEVLMHFTTLIYPSGYTVMLPGAVENVPGAEKTSIKGQEVGAGIGGAVGTAIALLSRGNDVKLDAGTTVEMVFQRAVPLDPNRIPPPVK
ncbi:MAG: hypothetical protein AUI17_07820 [Acidobacteriales bacterium 13_2_20CM_2_55_5]|nr:MAG: hypothetical protein AUI17_07820 [Acidobacteriales bacterium 13_2_20CM_2_55_5]